MAQKGRFVRAGHHRPAQSRVGEWPRAPPRFAAAACFRAAAPGLRRAAITQGVCTPITQCVCAPFTQCMRAPTTQRARAPTTHCVSAHPSHIACVHTDRTVCVRTYHTMRVRGVVPHRVAAVQAKQRQRCAATGCLCVCVGVGVGWCAPLGVVCGLGVGAGVWWACRGWGGGWSAMGVGRVRAQGRGAPRGVACKMAYAGGAAPSPCAAFTCSPSSPGSVRYARRTQ